ncbi:hypothetical protein HYALB_00006316 [Hymenoscyphus albidus]|uniref:Uncharacterized protein n=1 Tax=Hymenoscyphus albidus TaxID=595503 RepID=A0A9N9Q4Y6_9HELO|nr:hypothetical protein HYALB_00006316 [Hymenoscyphus albidus]
MVRFVGEVDAVVGPKAKVSPRRSEGLVDCTATRPAARDPDFLDIQMRPSSAQDVLKFSSRKIARGSVVGER